jgi:hypothetical protein
MGEGGQGTKTRRQAAIGAAAAGENQRKAEKVIVRMKRRKTEEAGTRRRGTVNQRGVKYQMRAATVTQTGRGTGRAGRTERGVGATAGAMTRRRPRMLLLVKKGSATATTGGSITAGMHLTLMAASQQMTRSDLVGGGGITGLKAVGRIRMSVMVIEGQNVPGRTEAKQEY